MNPQRLPPRVITMSKCRGERLSFGEVVEDRKESCDTFLGRPRLRKVRLTTILRISCNRDEEETNDHQSIRDSLRIAEVSERRIFFESSHQRQSYTGPFRERSLVHSHAHPIHIQVSRIFESIIRNITPAPRHQAALLNIVYLTTPSPASMEGQRR